LLKLVSIGTNIAPVHPKKPMSHTPKSAINSPIWEMMRGMGPTHAPDGAKHIGPDTEGAVMCSVMILNSVIERQGNRILEEHGLTLPQWLALGCVASGGLEGVPHAQIGATLMLSKAPVTGVVDRLERAGLVERKPDAHDRRVSRVVISAEGTAMWWRVEDAFKAYSRELFSGHLKEAEQEQLIELLGRMLEAFGANDPHAAGQWKANVALSELAKAELAAGLLRSSDGNEHE